MTRTAPVILLHPNMTPRVCRDMADLAADLIARPSIDRRQIQDIAATLAHWSEVVRTYGRASGAIAITALRLMRLSRLTHAELGELARWLLRRAAELRQEGGAA